MHEGFEVAVCVEQGDEGSDDSTSRGAEQSRPRRSRPAEEKDPPHDQAADHQRNEEVLRTAVHSVGWKHEHAPLSNGRHRTATNVCGQPNSLQIRSHVSKVGDRVPTSISRYSRRLTPRRYAL
jgi:hypothetical protein